MRLAWDGRRSQRSTKNNPEKATGAHVAVVGHITVDEFRALLDDAAKANGFANRFLVVMAQAVETAAVLRNRSSRQSPRSSRRLLREIIDNTVDPVAGD